MAHTRTPESLLREAPTAILSDAMVHLRLSGWMDDVFPLQPGARIAGRARTMLFGPTRGADQTEGTTFGFIRSLAAGEVLVVGGGGTTGCLIGDNIVKAAQLQQLSGIVTDARSRDVEVIEKMSVPVFCRGAGAKPSGVELIGRDVLIVCGGAQVRPGDLVIGDRDGIVIIPSSRVAAVADELADLYTIEAALSKAVDEQLPLAEFEEILKRKRAPRQA